MLAEENLKLKKLLRENGISWSPIARAHLQHTSHGNRKTRSAPGSIEPHLPTLPTEVVLRILRYAMRSPYPIIDPLSPLSQGTVTEEEKSRGNQIAIHFLATCRAFQVEGTQFLWEQNNFVFTSSRALHHFSALKHKFRQQISHVTFRVIARYYDDQPRKHKLERFYHGDLTRDYTLRVKMRPQSNPPSRGGFRCYTWNQVIDFLAALRAPHDPSIREALSIKPRLLPSLSSLRIDLVNFSDTLLPFSGPEFHDITTHEFGCTLNELQITGMPFDDTGMKASAELAGLLKDEGLILDGPPSFVALSRNLSPLSGKKWCARVIRAWKAKQDEFDPETEDSEEDDDDSPYTQNHPRLGTLPPAPREEGHPPSSRDDNTVIWKRVPLHRDEDERQWVQFSRFSGYEINDHDSQDEEDGICPCCGELHPGSSFMDALSNDGLID